MLRIVSSARCTWHAFYPLFESLRDKDLDFEILLCGGHSMRSHRFPIPKWPNMRTMPGPMSIRDPAAYFSAHVDFFENTIPYESQVLVQGDRIEALAAATVARARDCTVWHLYGGDVSGTNDHKYRWAISMLSDHHFPSTSKSMTRLLDAHVSRDLVHLCGDPAFDVFPQYAPYAKYKHDLIMVLVHPIGRFLPEHAEVLYNGLKEWLDDLIVIGPGPEPYSDECRYLLGKRFGPKYEDTLDRDEFLTQLTRAKVLVGNTSAGIAEAPVLRTAFVSVGVRQAGRERGRNVIDVEYNIEQIQKAVKTALDPKWRRGHLDGKSPYYDGKPATPRIVKVMEEHEVW